MIASVTEPERADQPGLLWFPGVRPTGQVEDGDATPRRGTMRTAWVEPSAGVTGDMWLGALVGAGASLERIQEAICTLGVGDVRLSYGRVRRDGHRRAVAVRIRAPEETPAVARHDQVMNLLRFAALDERARELCIRAYTALAEAEAQTQGTTVDGVTYNEFAMLDTIADIVGTAVGLADLGVEQVLTAPVTVGHGVVDTFHGPVAVPGPTVRRLLEGLPTVRRDTSTELVTVAGAALLRALATPVDEAPELHDPVEGLGAGAVELRDAGVLRIVVGDHAGVTTAAAADGEADPEQAHEDAGDRLSA